MTGMPKRTPLQIKINPATLPADLRERARLCRFAWRAGSNIDAQYLEAAAAEIEELRKLADHRLQRLVETRDEIGEPEDAWPRCEHGSPIRPGAPAGDYCPDCFMASE